MKSCGSAHYWGRVLGGLGHEVRSSRRSSSRPFVKSNKVAPADAEAIWEAAQRPGMRLVALKSDEQRVAVVVPYAGAVGEGPGDAVLPSAQPVVRVWHCRAKRVSSPGGQGQLCA